MLKAPTDYRTVAKLASYEFPVTLAKARKGAYVPKIHKIQ